MIWQLIKRDQMWLWTPLIALFTLFMNQWTADAIILFTLVNIGFAPSFATYCSVFEGALPIRARDLWLSRVMSLLAAMWLPVAVASTIRLASGKSPVALLEAAAVYTVLMLAIKSYRAGQYAPPEWFRVSIIVVSAVAAGTTLPLIQSHLPPITTVLGICGVVSGALFLKGWNSVPPAFQIAPAKVGSAGEPVVATARARFVWAPVIGSLYGSPAVLLLLLVAMFTQITLGSFLFWFLVMVTVQVQARGRIRWLLHLPIASNVVFAIVTVPPAVAILAGSILNLFFDKNPAQPVNARIVEIAGQIVVLFVFVVVTEMFRWSRLSRLPLLVRGLPALLMWTALVVAMILSAHNGGPVLDDAAGWIAARFHGYSWMLRAVLTASVFITYWLSQRVFGELEYPNIRVAEAIK